MSLEVPSGKGVFDPAYWEGFDIRTGQGNLRDRKMWKIAHKQHNKLVPILKSAIEEVLQGNYTEIRYGSGKEFNPQAEGIHDGSVVVVDFEELTILPRRILETEDAPVITEPYVGYWLDNQPSPPGLGFDVDVDEDADLTYRRDLTWGVVTTVPVYYYDKKPVVITDRRVIQPISFSEVSLDDEKIKVPKFHNLKSWHHVLVLPEVIGDTEVTRHKFVDGENTYEIESIGRIRSIDLVHLAQAGRKRRWSPALGRLAVPKSAGA
jgi:hypothetical protein